MSEYRLKPGVLAQQVVDEMVILEPEGGTYFTLNNVGAEMINALAQGKGLEQVVAEITTEFNVTVEQARQDYLALLEHMHAQGLVEKY